MSAGGEFIQLGGTIMLIRTAGDISYLLSLHALGAFSQLSGAQRTPGTFALRHTCAATRCD
ncbi:MAG: hypothetical protein WDZ59_12885 [Pirellulales bacterium]